MRDGSDAIADWPILNALVNVAAGATWVSVHHGGGVGIGNSIHAGMVVVADGTDATAERLERVLTTDPGMGVARHADAGYDEALAPPPASTRSTCRRSAREPAATPDPRPRAGRVAVRERRAAAGCRAARRHGDRGRLRPLRGGPHRRGRAHARPLVVPATRSRSTDGACRRSPASSTVIRTRASRAIASRSSRFARAGATYEELHARGGGILSTVRATRAASASELADRLAEHVGWMRQAGTTTFEAKSGYGLDHDTELAQLRADRGRGRRRDLARRARRPARVRRTPAPPRTSSSSSRRCSRRRLSSPRPRTSSSSAEPSTSSRRAAT